MLKLFFILATQFAPLLLAQGAPATRPAATTRPAAPAAAQRTLTHYERGGDFFMPPQASTTAHFVDDIYYFIFWICVFFFVLIVVLMFWFAWKYRRRGPAAQPLSSATHNTTIELVWSIIPTLLCVPMFWYGFKGYMDVRNPPANAYEVQVDAVRWSWSFTYPNGITSNELHVPEDTPIRCVLNSQDVLHSFFVPDFRVKMDVVPGRYNKVWFEAKQPGEHVLLCAEYCGKDHSIMTSKVVVHTKDEFPIWLENADPLKKLTDEQYAAYEADPAAFIAQFGREFPGLEKPVQMGEKIYAQVCKTCHTTDGQSSTGPTFKGLWGKTEKVNGGQSVVVDEAYVQESIWEPNAKIVDGFAAGMPTFKGRYGQRHVRAIIEYLKTVK